MRTLSKAACLLHFFALSSVAEACLSKVAGDHLVIGGLHDCNQLHTGTKPTASRGAAASLQWVA